MPSADIVVSSQVKQTARLAQLEGMFDLPAAACTRLAWEVDLPIEERNWNIGLIVGPSGSGKSTIAAHLFNDALVHDFRWPKDRSVLDGFPPEMSVKDVTGLLSAVGFSSPPAWARPFHVLSTGEQFRAHVARVMAEQTTLAVIDEFTSVVDRTVAQIGSHAIAKTVRQRGQQLIAVTCHEDVAAWLQPDWTYQPATDEFTWGCLQPRPRIELQVCRVPASAWRMFHAHHYLSAKLHKSATCFAAFWGGRIVAFSAWLPIPGQRGARREHRTVTLPDYQGVGIGNHLSSLLASMWRGLGCRAYSRTSHPAMVASRNRSECWAMTRPPGRVPVASRTRRLGTAVGRLTASFQYVGAPLDAEIAQRTLNYWACHSE